MKDKNQSLEHRTSNTFRSLVLAGSILVSAATAQAQMDIRMQERSIPSQQPVTAKFEVKGVTYNQSAFTMIDSISGIGTVNVFSADVYVRQLKAINHFLMKDSTFVNINSNRNLEWEPIYNTPINSTHYNNILEVMSAIMGFKIGQDGILKRFPTGNIQVHHINRPANFVWPFDSMKVDLYNKTDGTITFTENTIASDTGWTIRYLHVNEWPQGTPLDPGWTDPATLFPDGKTYKGVTTYILIDTSPEQNVMSREALRAIGGNDGATDPEYVSYHNAGAQKFHTDEGKAIKNMYKMKIGTDLKLYKNQIVSDLSSVKINDEPKIANEFTLEQNYPNPFNPSTTIQYSLKSNAHVKIGVYNTIGQKVMELDEGIQTRGTYKQTINAQGLSSGTYIIQTEFNPTNGTENKTTKTIKTTLIK